MREIPLINLYNYAYTFDRLIIELYYGLQNENARKIISDLCNPNFPTNITSAKDMLVALLIKPYMPLEGDNSTISPDSNGGLYEKHVKDMLVGVANSGELGRPKFLSDQIYNKAVFGEVYMTSSDYNEMGPATGHLVQKQITKQSFIAIYANILAGLLVELQSNGRFQGCIFRAGSLVDINNLDDVAKNVKKIIKFCVPIVICIIDNPTIRLDILSGLIYNRFLDDKTGITEFKRFRNKNDSKPSECMLSTMSALVAKLIHCNVALIVQAIGNGTFIANTGSVGNVDFQKCIQVLQSLTCNKPRMGAAFSNADIINTINGVRSPNDTPEMVFYYNSQIRLVDEIYISSMQIPTNDADQANANQDIVSDDNLINIIKLSLFNIPYSDSVAKISISNKRGGSIGKLHWLDINLDPSPDPDDNNDMRKSRSQPSPYGDNNNVLDSGQVKSVVIPKDLKLLFTQLGRLRFDTVLIRNLVFIVNLYRSVRMKLQRDLNYDRTVTLKSIPITRSQLTEFYGNQVDHGRATSSQSQRDMYARFNY